MAVVNITPQAPTDGIVYATAVPLTTTEATLGDATYTPAIIPVVEGQTIVVVVRLSLNGHVNGNNTFIFLQTDLGDGVWVDVAWAYWNKADGTATFVLCGGGLGAMNNAFQQARQASAAPAAQANGSNAVPLGGRCRITGFATTSGGSSSVSGTTAGVLATVTYKLQHPR